MYSLTMKCWKGLFGLCVLEKLKNIDVYITITDINGLTLVCYNSVEINPFTRIIVVNGFTLNYLEL
jgi:hypothetical protein